jgi:thiol:disulfide interchange protein DsbC
MKTKIVASVVAAILIISNLNAIEQPVALIPPPNQQQVNHEYELIKQVIPNTKIRKYKKSIIEGFYNIYLENGEIIYVNPFKNLILFGEIWNPSGNSLTATEREQWQKELNGGGESLTKEDRVISELKKGSAENKAWNKELVKQGIKDGKGGNKKYRVVVIESPTCPHCRELNQYLSTFDNTTYRYYSNEAQTKSLYKDKYGIAEPDKKIQEQGNLIAEKIRGIGVPFGIIVDENDMVVDAIIGFSDRDNENLAKWNKYLK